MESVKNLLAEIAAFIQRLNSTSLKRIFIYAVIIYPLVFGVYYKDEIVFLLAKQDKQVKVRRLDSATKRCFELRLKYRAEAVVFYLYQPDESSKTYMERVSVSTSRLFEPLESNAKVQLLSRTHEIEDMKKQGFAKVTKNSGHVMSNILLSYELEAAYIIPIRNMDSGAIIGEVMYVFKNDEELALQSIINETQIFAYDIH